MELLSFKRQLDATLSQVSFAIAKQKGTSNISQADNNTLLQVEEASRVLETLGKALPQLSHDTDTVHCQHDNKIHDPLGAGSYVYKDNYIPSLFRYLMPVVPDTHPRPTTVVIHIGAQPNNSLHAGTIVVFSLAFLIGREMLRYHRSQRDNGKWRHDLDVRVQLDLVDTAPDNHQMHIQDGIVYQRSQRNTQAMERFLPDYAHIVQALFKFVNEAVPYSIENQETLMGMECIPSILSAIVKDRERLGGEMSPQFGTLAIRCACPQPGCGYAEKHGRTNAYSMLPNGETVITFQCPDHGAHAVSLSDPRSIRRLEFNTPLRNLVRALAYAEDTLLSENSGAGSPRRVHFRVTGADYAGMYQEQLLWRQLAILPLIKACPLTVYAPLIVDWAGSKLSKSLYVEPGAYQYLRDQNMDYLLSFQRMKDCHRDEKILFREVEKWVQEPKKLFRSFSIEYLHSVFEKESPTLK